MQAYCESIGRKNGVKRSLISSMHGKGIIILTPLLKWYLENGLVVGDVEYIIKYNPKPCFDWFMNQVCDERRAADIGGSEQKIIGEMFKLMGNNAYGGILMDKSKHTTTSFAKEKNLDKHTNNPFFKNHVELNKDIFEVTKQKSKIVHDLPIQLGLAVYSYAKLRMLEFWNFINTYLENDLYQLMETDTDSLYIAFAKDTIDECVKPHLKEQWETEKWNWFCSEDTETYVEFRGESITKKEHDRRTPGKFKEEYRGIGMICLNSKTYIIWESLDGKKWKLSSKGVQEKRNELTPLDYIYTLHTHEPKIIENAGLIRDKQGLIHLYTQQKQGISYFYCKRKILPDGISTTHLDI
jgi:hypothetical protein